MRATSVNFSRIFLVWIFLLQVAAMAIAQDRNLEKVSPAIEDQKIEEYIEELRKIVAPTEQPKAKVLLCGFFHLANPGLDAHASKYTFNVFSDEGKKQLEEVRERLLAYQPTKILIESSSKDQEGVDAWFEGYKKGNFSNQANESLTVGCELAMRLGHKQVFGFDTEPNWLTTIPQNREAMQQKAAEMNMTDKLDSKTYKNIPKYGTDPTNSRKP